MYRHTLLPWLSALMVVLRLPAVMANDAAPLVSAMVDPNLFRPGAVQRSTQSFGAWTLVCDEIAQLGRRFCSLGSAPARSGGGFVRLDVSTGDDGRPAALLHLPFGVSLADGVGVTAGGARQADGHTVPVALCSALDCQAVWTLTRAELAALNDGRNLVIRLRGWRSSLSVGPHAKLVQPPIAVEIPGVGFSEAIQASLK